MIYYLNLVRKIFPELQYVKHGGNRAFLEYLTADQGTVELRRVKCFS